MPKQQGSSKQQQQPNQSKQQAGQTSQSQKQKQASQQASMNEYGTMTAKQDANADYTSAMNTAASAATGADSAALNEKAKKYAENQNSLT